MYLYSFFFFIVYVFMSIGFFSSFFGSSLLFNFYLFSLSGLDFSFSFVFDYLSFGFFSCVSFISSIVFMYSIFYMEGTIDMRRFGWLVFLFVLSMFFLVFSGNFILTMVGWDGLGLVSFCLVIFYSNSSSLESGLVTVFSNRVGDVFFLLSFLFFYMSGSFNWDVFFLNPNLVFLFLIFMGAITKSAQVPYSAWLPAAMAAPTPVSSLVHSSTLVTAGVYVLIRFNYLFSFFFYNFFKFFFLLTMMMAGVGALVENDFKKVVAMSTLSQLGMMMFILSFGIWLLSFIHMVVHSFFKSMLFLSTGSLMGQMGGSQDSRVYGGFSLSYNSFLFFSVSCLCLGGFPFFLGFYSKDFIITSTSYFSGVFFYLFFMIGCVFTVLYSFRLLYQSYYTFFKYYNFYNFSESKVFFLPVMMLFLKCWLLGGFLYWFFLTSMTFFFFYFDVFLGIFLFFMSFFVFKLLEFFYFFLFSFSTILYLRWKSSSGSSFYKNSMAYSSFEGSWMEIFGGGGVYHLFSIFVKSFNLLKFISLGMMVFFSFFVIFYFL